MVLGVLVISSSHRSFYSQYDGCAEMAALQYLLHTTSNLRPHIQWGGKV